MCAFQVKLYFTEGSPVSVSGDVTSDVGGGGGSGGRSDSQSSISDQHATSASGTTVIHGGGGGAAARLRSTGDNLNVPEVTAVCGVISGAGGALVGGACSDNEGAENNTEDELSDTDSDSEWCVGGGGSGYAEQQQPPQQHLYHQETHL